MQYIGKGSLGLYAGWFVDMVIYCILAGQCCPCFLVAKNA